MGHAYVPDPGLSQLENWSEELTDFRRSLGAPEKPMWRFTYELEELREHVAEVRRHRSHFYSVEDLAMLLRGVDGVTQEYAQSEVLAGKYLAVALKARGPGWILEERTVWDKGRQRELAQAYKQRPRKWTAPERARRAVDGVKDLAHNPLIALGEIHGVLRYLDGVRRVLEPLIRRLVWELITVHHHSQAELAAAIPRSRSWVSRQYNTERQMIGYADEPKIALQAHRDYLLAAGQGGLRVVR